MELSAVKDLVRSDLNAVDAVIRARMKSDVELVDQVAEHIISGGGKRLRPLIVVLAARACGYTGSSHIDASAFIEFIHTATLLHDDVVDGSSRRRGRDTANSVYGNQASVLVGDFRGQWIGSQAVDFLKAHHDELRPGRSLDLDITRVRCVDSEHRAQICACECAADAERGIAATPPIV